MPKFVVHEHHASRLHFDFRLEMEGVFKSWAIPKGPSMNPHDKRLAIMVDDHPLEYGSYEGIIPEGNYGAGAVLLWDKGECEYLGGNIGAGRLEFSLKGRKLKRIFILAKMAGKEKEWLLVKKKDDFAEGDFQLKTRLTPSLLRKLKTQTPPCDASQH